MDTVNELHNPKTNYPTYITVYAWNGIVYIDVDRLDGSRRKYSNKPDIDRLLKILNSDNYVRYIETDIEDGMVHVLCFRKE